MLGAIWDSPVKKAAWAIVGTVLAIAGYQFAVDTQDYVTVSQAQALKDAGVERAIVGLTYWSPCGAPVKINQNAEQTLRSFQTVGIKTSAYALVDSHLSGHDSQVKARSAVSDQSVWDQVEWVGVDFEIPAECYNAGTRIDYTTITDATDYWREEGKCVQWTDGCRSVLYTSCGEWTSRLDGGIHPKPPMTLLWNASWNGQPDIIYGRCPFAGYTEDEVLLEQYNGGTTIAGVNVDSNTLVVYDTPTPAPVPPTPTPTPPPVIKPPACSCCEAYTREQMLWALTAAGFIEGMKEFGGTEYELHPFDKAILACISK